MSDLIDRQAAIDAAIEAADSWDGGYNKERERFIRDALEELPSAQLTLCGYNIKHLELIARILQKEDLQPENIAEVLSDIGRIVAIIKDEFEETLRKAAEQCTI